jgi:nucleotide-binding universal stress UspA family protein
VVVLALPSDVAPAADITRTLGIPPDTFVVRQLGAAQQRESQVATLLETLQGHRPDLLVHESHNSTEIGKCLSGAVAEQLFCKVRRPVLVYGPHAATPRARPTGLRNVLYATDLSAASVQALHSAYDVARNQGAKLVVLQVTAEPNEEMLFDDAVTTFFERLQDWFHNHVEGYGDGAMGRAQCLVKFGKAGLHILQAASELHPEMIVIGARGMSASSRVDERFVGDTAYEVACSSESPVLVVPDLSDVGPGTYDVTP